MYCIASKKLTCPKELAKLPLSLPAMPREIKGDVAFVRGT